MPLGTEVDIGAGHIAKGAQHHPPLLGPCLLWPQAPISATAELVSSCFSRDKMLTSFLMYVGVGSFFNTSQVLVSDNICLTLVL